ncbi:MAG: ABC transporter permease, partial [Bacteroidales bacterium]|nr:ABC transporter permease [Bacteroidales bacterium]
MKFEYFVGKRLTKQKEKTYARPVVKIAIASTALSIAVMLIALSVLEGFKTEIKNKIAGFGSHIQVVSYGS